MSAATASSRLPWEDRWVEPTLEQLLEPIEPQRRDFIKALMEQTLAFPGVKRSLVWHGTAWKWTIEFNVHSDEHESEGILAYVVPVPAEPIFCIPLTEQEIDKLPIKRLNKYIREGIHVAKRGVKYHWAVWTPTAGTEVEYLTDLVKRKHKFLTTGDPIEDANDADASD